MSLESLLDASLDARPVDVSEAADEPAASAFGESCEVLLAGAVLLPVVAEQEVVDAEVGDGCFDLELV
jgi:hypothetical protein